MAARAPSSDDAGSAAALPAQDAGSRAHRRIRGIGLAHLDVRGAVILDRDVAARAVDSLRLRRGVLLRIRRCAAGGNCNYGGRKQADVSTHDSSLVEPCI